MKNKITKLPFHKDINIGIVIFGVIFIYLVGSIVMYLTAPRITVYEVRQGSILKDNAYTGVAIREEMQIVADDAGYINYYAEENSKVRAGANVYTVSDKQLDLKNETSDSDMNMSDEEFDALMLKIQAFNHEYKEHHFSSTYQLKNDIQNSINKIVSQGKIEQLDNIIANESYTGLNIKRAPKDGVVVYAMDSYDGLTLLDVSPEIFKKANYKQIQYENNSAILSGEPIYKIVTSDKWSLLLEINDDTKSALESKKSVKVRFKKDGQELYGKISYLNQNESNILCLDFNDSMIRYITERYLDVELILEDETGLKIPKTAETSKEFYVVPNTYLTQGGNSSSDGVMRQTKNAKGETIIEFMEVTVYFEENEMIYLDPNAFETGDLLIKPESNEQQQLTEKRSLKGVYCINKGYAVFKQITILCESDDYYIIEEGNSFGLSNYDHIALNSNGIKENDVVF